MGDDIKVPEKEKKPCSEETREKIRKALIGKKKKPLTEEHKKKIGKALIGKKHTEEHRKNNSKSNKGKKKKPLTEEHKKKIGKANSGKKRTAETRQKQRESMSGEKNHHWKIDGDHYNWWHYKAWKSFGKNKCSRCGMTNEESIKKYKRRLYMHCTGDPKDYTLQEEGNWETYCISCHGIVERTT